MRKPYRPTKKLEKAVKKAKADLAKSMTPAEKKAYDAKARRILAGLGGGW